MLDIVSLSWRDYKRLRRETGLRTCPRGLEPKQTTGTPYQVRTPSGHMQQFFLEFPFAGVYMYHSLEACVFAGPHRRGLTRGASQEGPRNRGLAGGASGIP